MEAFFEMMKKKRDEMNLTNYKLAKLTGINEQTIYKLEHGLVRSTNLIFAIKIAKVLDIDLNELKE